MDGCSDCRPPCSYRSSYIYPSRTRFLRPLNLGVLAVWVLVISWVGVRPDPDPVWVRASLLGPAYYVGLSLLLNIPAVRAASSRGQPSSPSAGGGPERNAG